MSTGQRPGTHDDKLSGAHPNTTLGRAQSFLEQVKTNNDRGGKNDGRGNVGPAQATARREPVQAGPPVADLTDDDALLINNEAGNIAIPISSQVPPAPAKLPRRDSASKALGDAMGALSVLSRRNTVDNVPLSKKRANDDQSPGQDRRSESWKLQKTTNQLPAAGTALTRASQQAGIKSPPSLPLLPRHGLVRTSSQHSRQRSLPLQYAAKLTSPRHVPLTRDSDRWPALLSPQGRSDSMKPQPTSSQQSPQSSRKNSISEPESHVDRPHTSLVREPESKPMPEGQLAAEIKAIYQGLVMIEAKCINVVNAENARLRERKESKAKLGEETSVEVRDNEESRWPPLISLHRALLQEHHDFFLASQHPASSPQLKNLANKYSMPARMWKNGIHNFLELLRHSLPDSMEFMKAFIILAYQMIALLYETVETFKDTWIECLGDLARYRMAIEDEDLKDRDTYTIVSRSWYNKASRRNVNIGRLYHHQAILARTQPLKQLSLYARSLAAVYPFTSARDSIMTLFEPVLSRLHMPGSVTAIDSRFIRLHAMRFTRRNLADHYNPTRDQFLEQLNDSIIQAGQHWKIIGEYMAIISIASLLMWGEPKAPMHRIFTRKESASSIAPRKTFGQTSSDRELIEHQKIARDCLTRLAPEWHLLTTMLIIVLKRGDDHNTLPFIHVIVSFIWGLCFTQYGTIYLDSNFPFQELADFLNKLEAERKSGDGKSAENSGPIVLSEMRAMEGQAFAQKLFPANRSRETEAGEEEEDFPEGPMAARLRKDRILKLSKEIAAKGVEDTSLARPWMFFDSSLQHFSVRQLYSTSQAPSFLDGKRHDLDKIAIADRDQPMTDFESV